MAKWALLDRPKLPTWMRALMYGLGVATTLMSILLVPDSVRQLLKDVPFLGEPVPWWVLLFLGLTLIGIASRYQRSDKQQLEVPDRETGTVDPATPITIVEGDQYIIVGSNWQSQGTRVIKGKD